jgi:hypothetical protein
MALAALVSGKTNLALQEDLQSLSTTEPIPNAVAILSSKHIPTRKERDAKLVMLRKAWPNRRFELSKKSPTWLLDALYLAGIVTDGLTIILPSGWHKAPDISALWEILLDRYQLTDIEVMGQGSQALALKKASSPLSMTNVHRDDFTFQIKTDDISSAPGSTQFWLQADPAITTFLLHKNLGGQDIQWSDALRWGAYLYLNTKLGKYIWALCTAKTDIPGPAHIEASILSCGIPIPDEMTLLDLSLSGSPIDQEIPPKENLEQDFTGIFGLYPEIPAVDEQAAPETPKTQRKSQKVIERISEDVFIDGIPRFPEHYLMHIYRPELAVYELDGPLKYAEEFFDKITLQSVHGKYTLEVSGKMLADALIMASWGGHKEVELPENRGLLEDILYKYRNDLKCLWDTLNRECRKIEPQRQAAIKMARKIWSKQGLPPESLF